MKNILILVDKIGPKKELFAQEIASRLKGKVFITLARISDLFFSIDNKSVYIEVNEKSLKDFDLVYIRRAGNDFSVLASTLAVALNHLKVKYFDASWGKIGPMGSKFTSLVRMADGGVPIMPTIYVWNTNILPNRDRIIKNLGLPLIAKELSTQRGTGVHRLDSAEDFEKLPMKDTEGHDNQYLFQKYIELEDEFRLLVLGDKAGVWEKKIVTVKGEFRHNVALGAREEFLDIKKIPARLEEIAVKACKLLDLQIAGVDVATSKATGEYVLIEVNRGPGFTYDTNISPEMEEIAKYLGKEAGV